MPKSTLPFSVPITDFATHEARDAPKASGSPAVHGAPKETRIPATFRKEVSAMFFRLIASFARSEDVHQARLDQCWNGPHWHLMGHSTWSVK